MAIWQSGDLIITLSGPTGTYLDQSLGAWGVDGTYRGIVSVAPPLSTTPGDPDNIPVVQPVIAPDSILYGYQEDTTEYWATMDGTANQLTNIGNANYATGQTFDPAGNRYFSDYNPTDEEHIRRIAPDSTETAFPYSLSDPNLFSFDPHRLQVNAAGTIVYWNQCADAPYHTTSDIGCTRLDLTSGLMIAPLDISVLAASIVGGASRRIADFVVSSQDEIFWLIGNVAANRHVIVTDLLGNHLRDWLASSDDAGGIAVNSSGTIIGVLHDIGANTVVTLFNAQTGASTQVIDFTADSGLALRWGLCFAPEIVLQGLLKLSPAAVILEEKYDGF